MGVGKVQSPGTAAASELIAQILMINEYEYSYKIMPLVPFYPLNIPRA
jgi:hypothetical protein